MGTESIDGEDIAAAAEARGLTVALADWHWRGHHPMSFRRYADVLGDLGVTVVPFVPRAGALDPLGEHPAERNSPGTRSRIQPARPVVAPTWERRLSGPIGRPLRQILSFMLLRRELDRWEREMGRNIDLVFFACVYDWEFDLVGPWVGRLLGHDWAGLYLQARMLHSGQVARFARAFACPRLRGLGTLDRNAVDQLAGLIPGRTIVRFPETVDVRLPAEGEPAAALAETVRRLAGGRRVVSLFGWLQRSKGLQSFTRLVHDHRLEGCFFVLAGELDWRGFTTDEARQLRDSWQEADNLFVRFERLDELELNALVKLTDVVFAAYVDFPHSSNVLAKAAFLGRPVVVSRGYLMQRDVEEYGLGIAVSQEDPEALCEAIRGLLADEAWQDSATGGADRPRRGDDYRRLHGEDHLVEAFSRILGAVSPPRPDPGRSRS